MNVLVTGGAGFIGSHACKALAASGYVPIAYDNLSRGHREAVKWGPFEEGDIADSVRVRAVLQKYRPVALMHFAAYAYVGESVEKPMLYYHNNVLATISLLQTLLQYGPIPFVFSSSCATYGVPKQIPITEDHPQQPINPYGMTKLIVERMLQDLGKANDLPWVALRYFNAAGSDPDGEIGEVHHPETHLIPLVLAAARDRTAVQIYGTDYDTADGTCIRDYVHVADISAAHVAALEYLRSGGQSCALNLSNARGYSVKEVIAAAERVCGCTIHTHVTSRQPGDPPILIGAADRARTVLNWKPLRSDLDVQIRDAWNWLKTRK